MMTHSDPELLAMLAMGETDVPDGVVDHLRTCEACRAELRSFQRVAELARSGSLDDSLGAPRSEVWGRVSATLGLDRAVQPRLATAVYDGVASSAPPQGAPDSPTRHRATAGRARRRRRTLLTGAALIASGALIAAVAVTATILVVRPASGEVIATAELDPLDVDADLSGDATVEVAEDGDRDVVVHLAEAAAINGYREVWLLSPEYDRLISLGALSGSTGRFSVPDGVDLRDYPVVDISVEQPDGNPGHSGDSVLRGDLDV